MRSGVALLQRVEDGSARIAAAGCADFPEVRNRHVFEVCSRRAAFGTMEDGLALLQFSEHYREFKIVVGEAPQVHNTFIVQAAKIPRRKAKHTRRCRDVPRPRSL